MDTRVDGACRSLRRTVCAGDCRGADDEEAVQVSAANLRALASFGRTLGIRVLTENFRALGTSVGALNAVLDLCEGEVGLCADFGNFKGRTNTAIWRRSAAGNFRTPPRPTSPQWAQMDREDFVHCLRLASDAGFAGPYSLIFSSRGDEWEGIEKTREVVEEWL